MAKGRGGQARINCDLLSVLPDSFPRNIDAWWTDRNAGLALAGGVCHRSSENHAASCGLWVCGELLPEHDNLARSQELATSASWSLFSKHGRAALNHLEGSFGLAFWDGSTLLLARDPLGQRAVYIRDDDEFYLISTSLEALVSDSHFRCQLDLQAAFHYLAFGTPTRGRSLARGVASVPAGHYLQWSRGQVFTRHRYFNPLCAQGQKVVDAKLRTEIRERLDESVNRRIDGGQNALLLSGGVDSSYIAASGVAFSKTDRLQAYTIRFEAEGAVNEDEAAAGFARSCGIQHHIVPLGTAGALEGLKAVMALAEPCSTWSAITHYQLIQAIRADGLDRSLSGLGADEIFGGYWGYFQYYKAARSFIDKWQSGDAIDPFDAMVESPRAGKKLFPGIARFLDDRALTLCLQSPFREWKVASRLQEFYRETRALKPHAHLFEMMVAHECQHRVPDLLFRSLEGVASSLGVRSAYPFLDSQVVQLGCALGASERFWLVGGRWKNKKALREIASSRLPSDMISAKPVSYYAPFSLWMADADFGRYVRNRLEESSLWNIGFVRRDYLRDLERKIAHASSIKAKNGNLLWQEYWILLTLATWHDRFAR